MSLCSPRFKLSDKHWCVNRTGGNRFTCGRSKCEHNVWIRLWGCLSCKFLPPFYQSISHAQRSLKISWIAKYVIFLLSIESKLLHKKSTRYWCVSFWVGLKCTSQPIIVFCLVCIVVFADFLLVVILWWFISCIIAYYVTFIYNRFQWPCGHWECGECELPGKVCPSLQLGQLFLMPTLSMGSIDVFSIIYRYSCVTHAQNV